MIDFKKDRILVTGANGMLGKAIIKNLEQYCCSNCIIGVDFPIDLRDQNKTENFFKFYLPDYVIHTAARVGGVKANSEHLSEFFVDNIRINTNVLECCHKFKVKKTLSLLSTCIYPDDAKYPLTEEQIQMGPPHESNYAYAYAKRMIDIQSRSYRDQYKENFITIVPNNLFGIDDNFDLESSHVIPAMIRKIYESKKGCSNVELWGDGTPLREFTYVDDLANIIIILLEYYNDSLPINVGNTKEYELKYLANLIAGFLNFGGDIKWNSKMPSGQFRKPSNNDKFKSFLDSLNYKFNYTPLEEGLKKTCDWFLNSYPKIRGIQ